ncbi:MAG: VanZ family protein [Gammaproteobacteria bacterium]|nr:VanZ family protein [Gammaproteobacteria bacterium]
MLGLALVPMNAPIPIANGDKILHALTFAFLTVWFMGVVEEGRTLRVLAGLVLYGLLIEFLQSFTTYRSADPYDVLADVAGIVAGWLLANAGLRGWCGRLEALLGAGPS